MSRRRFGRWIAVLVASAVAIVAPVPMLTPAAEAARADRPRRAYLNQAIIWAAAAATRLAVRQGLVPEDWKNATHGTMTSAIAIAYLKASGASKGLLTTNPGGPGTAGRTFTEALSWSKPSSASTTCSASTPAASARAPTSSA